MMSLDQKSDIKRLMAVFFVVAHALFCWQQYKTDVQKFAFWLSIDTGGAAQQCGATTATGRNHSAAAAAASKGKKGRSRNYYSYLVPAGKHPDFQSLLALAQA